jgi:predicted MFS family arabinose efflux permease
MVMADHLLRRRSPYRLLLTSMLIYVGMRTFVFLFPSVPSILLAQLVHGLCFSLYVVALVRFIGKHTVPTETRLVLAFFNVTLPSLTAIISSPLSGTLYDHFGPRVLYAIAATGYLLAWLCLLLAVRSRVKVFETQG